MSFKLQIFIFFITFLFIVYSLNILKKDKFSLKYFLSWIFISVTILFLTIKPVLLYKLSDILGIYDPMNALFFLGFIFVLIILYIATISQSRSSEKIKILTQEIAIKNYEIDRLNKYS